VSAQPGDLIDLSGKVAIVTGSTRGLGREVAFALARHGADLVITSRKADACQQVAAEVEALTGRHAFAHPCHVGDWDQIDRLVEASYARYGKVDILVNNAGMSPMYDDIAGVSEELYDKTLAVNLKGPFRLCALLGSRMASGAGGVIVNISSIASLNPSPDYLPYAAAKAGLNAITVGFAKAFGPRVRVNCIAAGRFRTDIAKSWDVDEVNQEAQKQTALKRIGEPSEIVGTVLYLVSDLSTFTTGTLIRVDGGSF
jgi:NAD(P)-dependent dehydrogenase (short-subunit alcohol dehydrogenase family)